MSRDSSRIHRPKSSGPSRPTPPWQGLRTIFVAQGASAFYVWEPILLTCRGSGEGRRRPTQLWKSYRAHRRGQCHHGITRDDSAPIRPRGYHDVMGYGWKVKSIVLPGGPVIAVGIWLPSRGQHPRRHMVDLR